VLSEYGSGSPSAHFRNRLCSIQSGFRTFPSYPFWKVDWLIKHDLFNTNFRRKQQRPGMDAGKDITDSYIQRYGTIVPKNSPERSSFLFLPSHQRCDTTLAHVRRGKLCGYVYVLCMHKCSRLRDQEYVWAHVCNPSPLALSTKEKHAPVANGGRSKRMISLR